MGCTQPMATPSASKTFSYPHSTKSTPQGTATKKTGVNQRRRHSEIIGHLDYINQRDPADQATIQNTFRRGQKPGFPANVMGFKIPEMMTASLNQEKTCTIGTSTSTKGGSLGRHNKAIFSSFTFTSSSSSFEKVSPTKTGVAGGGWFSTKTESHRQHCCMRHDRHCMGRMDTLSSPDLLSSDGMESKATSTITRRIGANPPATGMSVSFNERYVTRRDNGCPHCQLHKDSRTKKRKRKQRRRSSSSRAMQPLQKIEVTESQGVRKDSLGDMRDIVLSEVTALIDRNENRLEYLLELFKELHRLSSDRLRTKALHAIRRILASCVTKDHGSDGKETEEDIANIQFYRDFAELTRTVDLPELREIEAAAAAAKKAFQAGAKTSNRELPLTSTTTVSSLSSSPETQRQKVEEEKEVLLEPKEIAEQLIQLTENITASQNEVSAKNCDEVPKDRAASEESIYLSDNGRSFSIEKKHESPIAEDPLLEDGENDIETLKETAHAPTSLDDVVEEIIEDVTEYLSKYTEIEPVSNKMLQNLRDYTIARSSVKYLAFTDADDTADATLDEFFHTQLSSILDDTFEKFSGQILTEIQEELKTEISDVIFNEISFFRVMQNIENRSERSNGRFSVSESLPLSLSTRVPATVHNVKAFGDDSRSLTEEPTNPNDETNLSLSTDPITVSNDEKRDEITMQSVEDITMKHSTVIEPEKPQQKNKDAFKDEQFRSSFWDELDKQLNEELGYIEVDDSSLSDDNAWERINPTGVEEENKITNDNNKNNSNKGNNHDTHRTVEEAGDGIDSIEPMILTSDPDDSVANEVAYRTQQHQYQVQPISKKSFYTDTSVEEQSDSLLEDKLPGLKILSVTETGNNQAGLFGMQSSAATSRNRDAKLRRWGVVKDEYDHQGFVGKKQKRPPANMDYLDPTVPESKPRSMSFSKIVLEEPLQVAVIAPTDSSGADISSCSSKSGRIPRTIKDDSPFHDSSAIPSAASTAIGIPSYVSDMVNLSKDDEYNRRSSRDTTPPEGEDLDKDHSLTPSPGPSVPVIQNLENWTEFDDQASNGSDSDEYRNASRIPVMMQRRLPNRMASSAPSTVFGERGFDFKKAVDNLEVRVLV